MEETVEFTAGDGTKLAGTLTRPATGEDPPAALLISGSGPLDRDSNMRGQVLDVANALAATLAKHGLASLRYDKRGIGDSGGSYATTGFDQESDDAFAALAALREIPGIDGDRPTVIGHSVGATIAIRIAAAESRLGGVVLLGAASRPGADVMSIQSERIAATMPGPAWLLGRWFQRRQERARRTLSASTEDVIRIGRSETPARWFREYMAYDPAHDLRGIRCRVLAITGGKDLQVEPGDVARIGSLVSGPFTGWTPEGLSHVLRTSPRAASIRSYPAQLKESVDAELLERVGSWTAG